MYDSLSKTLTCSYILSSVKETKRAPVRAPRRLLSLDGCLLRDMVLPSSNQAGAPNGPPHWENIRVQDNTIERATVRQTRHSGLQYISIAVNLELCMVFSLSSGSREAANRRLVPFAGTTDHP